MIRWKQWLFTILAFIAFFYMYALFSYFGIKDFIEDNVLKAYFETNAWHLEIIVTGLLFGTLFVLINQFTETKVIRKRSFGFNILIRSTLYLLALCIACLALYYTFSITGILDAEIMSNFHILLTPGLISSFVVYWVLFILLMNFLTILNYKFGPRTLIELLSGKYYHPRTEEYIFLFLDLKDSTRLAEKMGHHDYSRFLKSAMHELTPMIQKYKARVYQYVGDEVVLYWTIKDGVHRLNCIETFFKFRTALEKQDQSFQRQYGETPRFKAGMDSGVVTATEIGDIKREIAFHGDVLNTSARLEKKCNEYNESFIISEHIVDQLDFNKKYDLKLLSDLPLKGKSESLKFYSVNTRLS